MKVLAAPYEDNAFTSGKFGVSLLKIPKFTNVYESNPLMYLLHYSTALLYNSTPAEHWYIYFTDSFRDADETTSQWFTTVLAKHTSWMVAVELILSRFGSHCSNWNS
jgi:hypothetical protein